MREFKIDQKNDGKNLNRVILNEFPNLSLNTLSKAFRQKDIKINGKRVSDNITVHFHDIVQVYISDELLNPNSSVDIKKYIVFEDDNVLIFNKPLDLPVTKDLDDSENLTDLVHKQLSKQYEPCHRLDRHTTGLVVFAKNKLALDELLYCFKHRLIEKYYTCIILGNTNKKQETLEAYLFKDSKKSTVLISDKKKEGYSEILTKYTTLKYDKENDISLLEVELLTGRTHQIRAHLAHIKHPILGDGKYGYNESNKKLKTKHQQLCATKIIFNTKNLTTLAYLDKKEIEIKYNFNFFN